MMWVLFVGLNSCLIQKFCKKRRFLLLSICGVRIYYSSIIINGVRRQSADLYYKSEGACHIVITSDENENLEDGKISFYRLSKRGCCSLTYCHLHLNYKFRLVYHADFSLFL